MFPWKWPSLPVDPHPTSNKAQTVSTPIPPTGKEQAGFLAPPPPWPASVAMATQSLAVGTVGLLGVLSQSVWVAEGGEEVWWAR